MEGGKGSIAHVGECSTGTWLTQFKIHWLQFTKYYIPMPPPFERCWRWSPGFETTFLLLFTATCHHHYAVDPLYNVSHHGLLEALSKIITIEFNHNNNRGDCFKVFKYIVLDVKAWLACQILPSFSSWFLNPPGSGGTLWGPLT